MTEDSSQSSNNLKNAKPTELLVDQAGQSEPIIKIEQLIIYPVKSCRGLSLQRSALLDEGLEHDRRWMIVDARGTFLTQRECPEMARIVPSLMRDASGQVVLQLNIANDQGRLYPGSPELRLNASLETGLRNVLVWKFEGKAVDCGHQASKFLSDFLQRPVRLVRFSSSETRICNKAWTGELTGRTFFSDGYPVLVLGQASVMDLANRMGTPSLAIERFRPNIVISGLPAYEEDFIRSLELLGDKTLPAPKNLGHLAGLGDTAGLGNSNASDIGAVKPIALRLVKPCPRCPVPKVDPWTGELGAFDPAAELATYRYHEAAEGAVLGMNAMAFQGQGQELAVGQLFMAIYDF